MREWSVALAVVVGSGVVAGLIVAAALWATETRHGEKIIAAVLFLCLLATVRYALFN